MSPRGFKTLNIDAAASLAELFLTGYVSELFVPPNELEDPLLIPFSVQPGGAPDAIAVTLGLRPSEDVDEPSAEVFAIVDGRIAALRAAHPELASFRPVVDFASLHVGVGEARSASASASPHLQQSNTGIDACVPDATCADRGAALCARRARLRCRACACSRSSRAVSS